MDEYDKTSVDEILKRAFQIYGKTLAETVALPENVLNSKNKGNLGSLIEQYLFEHIPPNTHDPDFPEAGLELKVTGVQRTKGGFKAKERLVLTMINYDDIVDESWDESTLKHKCHLMLILFYLYERETPVQDLKFVIKPLLHEIAATDLLVIEKDWRYIQDQVKRGKAHELSEGDTYYLGACRKGSGGSKEALRKQPFSSVLAPARAFSFKPGYVNALIARHASEQNLEISESQDFEQATKLKFEPYIGKSTLEIGLALGISRKGPTDKLFTRRLAESILGAGNQSVAELDKASIELKTVRLKPNGIPAEHMSFPGFKYQEIVNEEWEQSSFHNKLEHRFLFVVFRTESDGTEKLFKVAYWNMPFEDREEAKRVWETTKAQVAVDARNLPGASQSRVAHVRPKAKNAKDTLPTPQGDFLVRKCFWLNKNYIGEVLGNL